MSIENKLTNIKDFVNKMLTRVYNNHDYIIGNINIFTTNLGLRDTTRLPGDGNLSIIYISESYRANIPETYSGVLHLSSTGESYYDNIINDILKSISAEYLIGIPKIYYRYSINLDDANDKIIELSNYSDEELKLYFKLR